MLGHRQGSRWYICLRSRDNFVLILRRIGLDPDVNDIWVFEIRVRAAARNQAGASLWACTAKKIHLSTDSPLIGDWETARTKSISKTTLETSQMPQSVHRIGLCTGINVAEYNIAEHILNHVIARQLSCSNPNVLFPTRTLNLPMLNNNTNGMCGVEHGQSCEPSQDW